MYHTTRGLILREAKYKESDKILTILTETEGKISAKARGVARTRSKLAAATQLLCFSELTLFGNKGLWTINEATTVEQFRGLRGDIELLALGSYIAELLEAVSDEDCPEPEILQLGLNSLYALASGLFPPEQVKAAFELRLMALSGFEPLADGCAVCGRPEPENPVLDVVHGVVCCAACREKGGLAMPLSPAALAALRHVLYCPDKKLYSFTLDTPALRQLGQAAEVYVTVQLERSFRTLDYYKSILPQEEPTYD